MNQSQRNELKYINRIDSFIKRWNEVLPYDKPYRKKYNIGFFSPEHLKCSLFGMLCDLREAYLESEQKTTVDKKLIEEDRLELLKLRNKK